MKILRNEKGIALVMVLMIALIGLAVVAALLYMVTLGTQTSGSHRFFRTADEAALGGSDIAAEFIKSAGLPVANLLNPGGLYSSLPACLQNKLTSARGTDFLSPQWVNCTGTSGPDLSLDPIKSPDLQFNTSNVVGMPQYTVFVKIVDTVRGNSSSGGLVTGGGQLGGAGVVAATTGLISPPHNPYLYRVEVQAQDANNAREKARYSGLYVY